MFSRATRSTPSAPAVDSPEFDSRFPRRLLFATAAAGVATAAAMGNAAPAEAASATTSWKLGGNGDVTSANFLGPTVNGGNLVFKTKYSSTTDISEKMRLSAIGRLGVGVTNPAARVDAIGSGIAVQGTSSSTDTSGRGVVGTASLGYGVLGVSKGNIGTRGEGRIGLWGQSTTGYGVVAYGATAGYFEGTTTGVSVYSDGVGISAMGTTGISARTNDGGGDAVQGNGGQYGVHGLGSGTAGVRGDSNYVGTWGQAPTYGLYGFATATTGTNYGVFGQANSGYAVYAQGNAVVTGTLSKSAGSFRIDHQLDPENRWLSHSFVESPDMMNVYNGNITTDGSGNATVALPDYFAALNRDFRYQLTVIGDFAQAVVSSEVVKNSFIIKTDKPKVKVSWQVTGIRQDAYAKENPIVVDTAKDAGDRGSRLFVPKGAGSTSPLKSPAEQGVASTTGTSARVAAPQDLVASAPAQKSVASDLP